MYSVGDYIVYGSNGVCKINDVGPVNMSGADKGKLYYTMTPCYIRSSSIFTPVDNERVVMRKVMSKNEAEDFIDNLSSISNLKIVDEKKRDQEYRSAVLTCDPKVIVGLLKTINDRMNQRQAEGKKVTSSDTKYLHMAEDSLYGELAISLGMEKDEVKTFIQEKMDLR